MLKQTALLIVPVLILAGCTTPTPDPASLAPDTSSDSQLNLDVSPIDEITMEGERSFTLSEIATHNTSEDCWFAIEGKVYDVTAFIASGNHPGGEAIVQGCGKDATSLFNNRPSNGTPHSAQARSFLPNYEIGILATE